MRQISPAGYAFYAVAITLAFTSSACADESQNVVATVAGFHEALRRGDGPAAMKLLAPDAMILEGGALETRAEYENHHLAADIEFAKTVPSARSDVLVKIEGNTAWLTSRSLMDGEFKGKPVKSSGAELIVLTKTQNGWQIRAIHWSSHKRAATE